MNRGTDRESGKKREWALCIEDESVDDQDSHYFRCSQSDVCSLKLAVQMVKVLKLSDRSQATCQTFHSCLELK